MFPYSAVPVQCYLYNAHCPITCQCCVPWCPHDRPPPPVSSSCPGPGSDWSSDPPGWASRCSSRSSSTPAESSASPELTGNWSNLWASGERWDPSLEIFHSRVSFTDHHRNTNPGRRNRNCLTLGPALPCPDLEIVKPRREKNVFLNIMSRHLYIL